MQSVFQNLFSAGAHAGARALGPAAGGADLGCNATLQTVAYASACMSSTCYEYVGFSQFYVANKGVSFMMVCHIGMFIETLAFSAHDLYTLRVSPEGGAGRDQMVPRRDRPKTHHLAHPPPQPCRSWKCSQRA